MKDVQWSFGRPQENPAQQSSFFCLVFDTNSPTPNLKSISSFRLRLAALRTARLFRETGRQFLPLPPGMSYSSSGSPRNPESGLRSRQAVWPAPGSADTELGVLMEPEVCHGETEVYTGVQA
jgi:hypothetical protein